jgi:hypothetical protein
LLIFSCATDLTRLVKTLFSRKRGDFWFVFFKQKMNKKPIVPLIGVLVELEAA